MTPIFQATRCFAIPGNTDSIIDMVRPETGRSYVYGHTLEEIRQQHPEAVEMDYADFEAAKYAAQNTPLTWEPSDEETYWRMLEALPPAALGAGAYLVGESQDHCVKTGRPRYQAYRKNGDAFEKSSRPMTRTEFRSL